MQGEGGTAGKMPSPLPSTSYFQPLGSDILRQNIDPSTVASAYRDRSDILGQNTPSTLGRRDYPPHMTGLSSRDEPVNSPRDDPERDKGKARARTPSPAASARSGRESPIDYIQELYYSFTSARDEIPLGRQCQAFSNELLSKFRIADRGISRVRWRPRWALREEEQARIFELISRVQELLDDLARLTNQESYRIDPKTALRSALEGSESLDELAWAFGLLQERLRNATDVAYKFYQRGKGRPAASPATTQSSLYDEMDRYGRLDQKLKVYIKHPRISLLLGAEKTEAFTANPDMPLGKLSAMNIDTLLREFPDRTEEDDPATWVWNKSTNRLEEVVDATWTSRIIPTPYVTSRSRERVSAVRFAPPPETVEPSRSAVDVAQAADAAIAAVEARMRPIQTEDQSFAFMQGGTSATPARNVLYGIADGAPIHSTPWPGKQMYADTSGYNWTQAPSSIMPVGPAATAGSTDPSNTLQPPPPAVTAGGVTGVVPSPFYPQMADTSLQQALGGEQLPVVGNLGTAANVLPPVTRTFQPRPSGITTAPIRPLYASPWSNIQGQAEGQAATTTAGFHTSRTFNVPFPPPPPQKSPPGQGNTPPFSSGGPPFPSGPPFFPSGGAGGGPPFPGGSGGGGGGGPPFPPGGGGGGGPHMPPNGGGGGPPLPPGGGGGGPPFPPGGGGGGGPPPGGPGGFPGPPVPPGMPGGAPQGGGDWMAPRMKNQLDTSALPEWDGGEKTAIRYFVEISELCAAGGYLPWQIGTYLWQRLTKGSAIESWYLTLPEEWKVLMRSHYLNYIYVVRTYWLGDQWINRMHDEYKDMRFRRRGHEHELPRAFVQARLMYSRILGTTVPGTPAEVREVMRTAPIAWKTALQLDTIPNTATLQRAVAERESELIVAATSTPGNVVGRDYFESEMRKLHQQLRDMRETRAPQRDARNPPPKFQQRKQGAAAHLVEAEDLLGDEEDLVSADAVGEVFASEVRRQRAPPVGGYPYPKDPTRTKLNKLPPSPCKHCGSDEHWDRECRHHMSTMSTEKSEERDYVEAYNAAIEYNASDYIDVSKLKFARISEVERGDNAFVNDGAPATWEWKPTMEEEEEPRSGPVHILEGPHIMERIGWVDSNSPGTFENEGPRTAAQAELEPREAHSTELKSGFPTAHELPRDREGIGVAEVEPPNPGRGGQRHHPSSGWNGEEAPIAPPPPPTPTKPVKLRKHRVRPDGMAAVGVSVLSIRGSIGTPDGPVIDLRLDSCADITLVSEEFYEALSPKPVLKQGLKMGLFGLTDKSAKMRGYFQSSIFVRAADAVPVSRTNDHLLVQEDVSKMASFVRRKARKRGAARRSRLKRRAQEESMLKSTGTSRTIEIGLSRK
ncbi:hypothetical protein B0H11DRAFT_1930199 [Mycena galericulata]|nr:hypothetical protein B0H11DRAFT_1930199 [Mycena galericulata]